MFETDCTWEILWQKIDLSDGCWGMIVAAGKELNFMFKMPPRPGDETQQMGWKNSPAFFCSITDLVRKLISRLLAITVNTGISTPNRNDKAALRESHAEPANWEVPINTVVELPVFVDDFMNGVAGPPSRASKAKDWK